MSQNNFFRGSIYHCVEKNGNLNPIYFDDGLMVVDNETGRIVDVGSFSDLTSTWDTSNNLIHFQSNCLRVQLIGTSEYCQKLHISKIILPMLIS